MQNTAEKNHEKSLCIPCEFCMLNKTRPGRRWIRLFLSNPVGCRSHAKTLYFCPDNIYGRQKSTKGGKKRLTKASGDTGSIQIPCQFSWEVYRLW